MIYIGRHSTDKLEDGYIGSGKLLWRAIGEFGKENFKRDILFIFDNPKEMFEKEIELVNDEFRSREDTYNWALGSESWGMLGIKLEPRSEEYREKMSKAKKGKKLPPLKPAHREKVIKTLRPHFKGEFQHSTEQKAKWSEERTGEGNVMFEKNHSAESNEKNRQSKLGKPKSKESVEKMKQTNLRKFLQKKANILHSIIGSLISFKEK